jgi:hypothetical protein
MLGPAGIAVAGATVGAWPRLTGTDIPGRGSKALNIAVLGRQRMSRAAKA